SSPDRSLRQSRSLLWRLRRSSFPNRGQARTVDCRGELGWYLERKKRLRRADRSNSAITISRVDHSNDGQAWCWLAGNSLPLPAPAAQTERGDAASKQRESGGKRLCL